MPLHLLGKKSWNVYNAANIARVKQDEAEAAAREDAEEQRMQEEDAARRVALLRGEKLPELIRGPESVDDSDRKPKHTDRHALDRRRQRRLRGEDDTDRDIRLALEDAATGQEVASRLRNQPDTNTDDAPLVDAAGHVQLIPAPKQPDSQNRETKEAQHRSKRQKPDNDDENQGIRFRDAAGYNQTSSPWYTTKATTHHDSTNSNQSTMLSSLEEKDVWGNEDPRRKDREQKRIISNDPFAVMQLAQRQLKQSEADRQKWEKEREAETRRTRRESRERVRRRDRHRDRREDRREDRSGLEFDEDSLDGFQLDNDVQLKKRPEEDRERRHRHRHDRHRSSHRDRHGSRHGRSQSPQRDRKHHHR